MKFKVTIAREFEVDAENPISALDCAIIFSGMGTDPRYHFKIVPIEESAPEAI